MCIKTSQRDNRWLNILMNKVARQLQPNLFQQNFEAKTIDVDKRTSFHRLLNNISQQKLNNFQLKSIKNILFQLENIQQKQIFHTQQYKTFQLQIHDQRYQKSKLMLKSQLDQKKQSDLIRLRNEYYQNKIEKQASTIEAKALNAINHIRILFIQLDIYMNFNFLLPQLIDCYIEIQIQKTKLENQFSSKSQSLINLILSEPISTIKLQKSLSSQLYSKKKYLREKTHPKEMNCQGSFQIFNLKSDEGSAYLLKINNVLRKSSIFSLKSIWNEQLRDYLLSLIKNNEINFQDSFEQLLTFLKLNRFKIYCLRFYISDNLYQKLLPCSGFIIRTLQNFFQMDSIDNQREKLREQINKNEKQAQKKQMTEDQFNHFFLKQYQNLFKLQKENQTQKSLFLQLKQFLKIVRKKIKKFTNRIVKELEEQLNNYLLFLYKTFQKLIADQIAFCIKSLILQNLNLYNTNDHQQEQIFDNEFDSIQNKQLTESKCMGCSREFVINKCIYDPTISNVLVKHFPTILKIKDYQVDFKDTICAMLNCGGGVILFDCYEINQNLFARGQLLTEKHKQQIQQRITSYIRWFYPRPEISKNIKITFIPIIGNRNKIKQQKFRNQFQVGVFITRIRIAPTEHEKIYFWFYSKKQTRNQDRQQPTTKFFSVFDHQNNLKLVNMAQARRLIKKTIKNNVFQQIGSNQFMIRKPVNIFGHECVQPKMGQQMTIKQNKYEIKTYPLSMKNQKGGIGGSTQIQFQFNFVSLLIAKTEDLARIKQKLIESKINCQIEVRFARHNLKPANNAAILYHDKKFEVVHNLISNDPRFRFNTGKPFMLINITKYLRFENRGEKNKLDNSNMLKHIEWLMKEFQKEKITFYEYNVDQKKKEYYLQASSKLSLLFMYFIINHHGQKVSFKNPFNLQKYSIESKSTQFKKIEIYIPQQIIQKQVNFIKQKSRQQSYKQIVQQRE